MVRAKKGASSDSIACLLFLTQGTIDASSLTRSIQNVTMLGAHVIKGDAHSRVQKVPVHCEVEPHVITARQATWRADPSFQ